MWCNAVCWRCSGRRSAFVDNQLALVTSNRAHLNSRQRDPVGGVCELQRTWHADCPRARTISTYAESGQLHLACRHHRAILCIAHRVCSGNLISPALDAMERVEGGGVCRLRWHLLFCWWLSHHPLLSLCSCSSAPTFVSHF